MFCYKFCYNIFCKSQNCLTLADTDISSRIFWACKINRIVSYRDNKLTRVIFAGHPIIKSHSVKNMQVARRP